LSLLNLLREFDPADGLQIKDLWMGFELSQGRYAEALAFQ